MTGIGLRQLKEKFTAAVNDMSIRRRIMMTVLFAFIVIGILVITIVRLNKNTMDSIGSSFQTNTNLDNFSTLLSQTETAMETYIHYRSFESIDLYYQYRDKAESADIPLSILPSADTVYQKEYVVSRLAGSFIRCTENTVNARRANNLIAADRLYSKTLQCYALLKKEISELNMLYSKRNALYYNRTTAAISTITRICYIIIMLIFCLCFMLVYLIISTITQPLTDISTVAHQLAERNFDVPLFNRTTHDEIGNICQAFDRMIISIREYIDTIWEKAIKENELYEKELEMKALYTDAQLRSLQNQINPHFLFNTLNTGAQLAMMEDADKTCYFLEQTSDFFRYNIQQAGRDSTIEAELGMVDNFMYIMQVRFGERYEFIKDIPDVPCSARIPGMIFQPIVENCIKHGLKNRQQGGKIIIKLERQTDFILVSISDNGCGFPQEVKAGIFAMADADSGILLQAAEKDTVQDSGTSERIHTGTGLINVISRLRLFYHRNDVFDISTGPDGQGTTFIIRIPYV
ncbi:MAG: histidine kinase [Treponema sp.]|jgi:sensor histidine kinase YesM|nr:histidine kinase [Treponema sp.]